jgi:hypothetical protein
MMDALGCEKMIIHDYMRLPFAVLGLKPDDVTVAHETRVYEDWNHSLPMRSAQGIVHAVEILDKLFAANLLNVDLPQGPVDEGEVILVRGVPMKVKYVQDRRLVLELPPGRKFRRRGDPVLIKAAPRKVG